MTPALFRCGEKVAVLYGPTARRGIVGDCLWTRAGYRYIVHLRRPWRGALVVNEPEGRLRAVAER